MALGYKKEEFIKMIVVFPKLYTYSLENIEEKISELFSLGFTKEEILNITKELPALYGLNIETIKEKIDFYDSINLRQILIEDPKNLMQSVELSKARYYFYQEIGLEIDEINYRKLFIAQKRFEKKYNLTKQDLINKYKEEKEYVRTL